MANQRELVNRSRAIYYGLFSSVFAFTYDKNRFKGVRETVELLKQYPLTDEAAVALENLDRMLKDGYEELSNEYDRVFFDPSSPVRTTASFYDEGYESGRKRVEMIEYILRTEFRRDEEKYTDTEDDIGFVCSFMYHLIEQGNGKEDYLGLQKMVFENILNIFVDEFIESILSYEKSRIFKEIVIVLRSFIEFERLFFDVQKPEKKAIKHGERTLPYVNLKKTGKGKGAVPSSCGLDIEEEEAVEEDM